ncbi:class I SAM-dependent methyltransferase [Motiliproteus sp.]|uniref:class I SAM-dependent methyltransferase n=1 Tax=Motiliproteus sp. TaxID=1898955 RepID=UPI003BA84273
MSTRIADTLIDLGLATDQSIQPYFSRVRDREDIAVLRCERSGAFVLSRDDHMDMSHYEHKTASGWGRLERQQALEQSQRDTDRRAERFGSMISSRRWLDVGTGSGGILDALAPLAAEASSVEPQQGKRELLQQLGYKVYADTEQIQRQDFEVVTLFHVFEHLTDPIGTLKQLRQRMQAGGQLVIEVPHAGDLLLSRLELETFKAFTFWSEHLILHSRQTLVAFVEAAGFRVASIEGCQRYPLANHLHWLAQGKPGGHQYWPDLSDPELDRAYEKRLEQIDCTDTLILIAEAPKN